MRHSGEGAVEDNRRQKVRETAGKSKPYSVTAGPKSLSLFQSKAGNSRTFGYRAVGILLAFLVILAGVLGPTLQADSPATLHLTSPAAYAGDVKYVYDELGRLVQAIDVPTG